MSTATVSGTHVVTGTWRIDPVHSSIGFAIDYVGGTFRGTFRDVESTLVDDILTGSARVASVDVRDENLAAHLQSPDFFDAESHPELRFTSSGLSRAGEQLTVHGKLTIKGVTQPVELTGTMGEPLTDGFGRERIGLRLSTTVDRTTFGITWNMPLPTGEAALGDNVTLDAELYLVKEA